jgi:hypothetical protein
MLQETHLQPWKRKQNKKNNLQEGGLSNLFGSILSSKRVGPAYNRGEV